MKFDGHSTSLFWSESMLNYLRRNFPTTTNNELAEWLGLGRATVCRKAKELGLRKDRVWMKEKNRQNLEVAALVCRVKGNPGQFKKGKRNNPSGEFKPGRVVTEEERAKISAYMRRWHRENKCSFRRTIIAAKQKSRV